VDAEVTVTGVERKEARSGNVRWVLTDDAGKQYTTFRPNIGAAAEAAQGKRARIEWHEEERNGFQNVYLDAVTPLGDDKPGGSDTDPDEVAWNTAVEAAPWLVGNAEPDQPIPPDELYEKLEPFKQRVADDIRRDGDDE
jgi:hypothetical protein